MRGRGSGLEFGVSGPPELKNGGMKMAVRKVVLRRSEGPWSMSLRNWRIPFSPSQLLFAVLLRCQDLSRAYIHMYVPILCKCWNPSGLGQRIMFLRFSFFPGGGLIHSKLNICNLGSLLGTEFPNSHSIIKRKLHSPPFYFHHKGMWILFRKFLLRIRIVSCFFFQIRSRGASRVRVRANNTHTS